MRWAGHAARMGEMRNAYDILVGKSEGKRDHLEDLGIDGRRIFLKRHLQSFADLWPTLMGFSIYI
jgi:hypothetical protein